ncbi:MAG: DUF4403 family protein [Fluviicola sp.]|nr:DUF4403 family protein [Fluviicola sp.]
MLQKKRKLGVLFLQTVLFGLSFSACKQIAPLAPANEVAVIPPIEQPVSHIIVPVELSLTNYFKQIDESVDQEFNGGEQQCEGVSYNYHFQRKPIKFSANNKKISYDVAGEYWIKMSYCPKCTDIFSSKPSCISPRIPFSCGINEPMRKMELQYSTSIGINEKYQLVGQTKLEKLEAKDPCEVSFFQYDATDILLKEVKKALTNLTVDIDKEIGKYSFKKEAESAWKSANQTIAFSPYGYLHIQPIALVLETPHFEKDKLLTTVCIDARPIFSSDPTTKLSSPLPPLKQVSSFPTDEFDLIMDLRLNYDSLSHVLQSLYGKKELLIKNRKVIIDSVAITGAAKNQLNIALRFSGYKKGYLYLTGTPTFDEATQTISVTSLDYDLATKHVLLKTAKWLFNDRILTALQDATLHDLTPQLHQLKEVINSNFHYTYAPFIVKGKVNHLAVSSIYPDEKELIIRVLSTGKVKVTTAN